MSPLLVGTNVMDFTRLGGEMHIGRDMFDQDTLSRGMLEETH
jgi:hypothetical protein